jgi:hypothetical protein
MKKFVANSRTLSMEDPIRIDLTVSGINRLPRKIKKKIKSMVKRVSTVELLSYIVGNEDD